MAEQRQLIYKLLLDLGTSEKDAKGLASEIEKIVDAANGAAGATDGFGNSISNTIKGIRSQITELKKQRDTTEIGSEAFVQYNLKIKDLESELKSATTATTVYGNAQEQTAEQTKELAKLQENQARSAGLAGAAAFELGRTISDLPFGIVAISNNISQLGTLFAALVANAGGVTKALGFLKAQLLNPVTGVLIAFQVVTAAVTLFSKKSNEAKKSTQDFSNELLLQSNILKALRGDFLDSNTSLEERIKILNTLALTDKNLQAILKDQELTEAERIKKAEEYIDAIMLVDEAEKELAQTRQDIEDDGRSLDELRAKRAEKEAERLALQAIMQTSTSAETILGAKLEMAIRDQQILAIDEQIKKYDFIKQQTLEVAKLRASLQTDDKNREDDYQESIAGTIAFIQEQISALEKQRDTFATTTAQVERYNRQIDFLRISLDRLVSGEPISVTNILGVSDEVEVKDSLIQDIVDSVPNPDEITSALEERARSFETKNILDAIFGKIEDVEKMQKKAEMVGNIASSLNDILSAQSDREIAIERNKTTAINDELKKRLANEELSAEQRDRINQQISQNEAALVEKQNEIAKKQFQREKALKIVTALADTFSSVSKAYLSQLSLPTPDAPVRAQIAAKIAAAFGLAQVAALSRLKYTEQGIATPNLVAQGSAGQPQPAAFNVVGASSQNQLAQAIAAQNATPIKTYVVSSDVTTSQELERKIVEGASI